MVDVNNVYQKVLAISNKEQRGYISPQEFNLLADKAQLDIVNSYFHDMKTAYHKPTKNQTEASDEVEMISEKLGYIRSQQTGNLTGATEPQTVTVPVITLNADCYKVGTVTITVPNNLAVEATEVGRKELTQMLSHPLTEPTTSRPVYVVQDAPNAGQLQLEIHTFGSNTANQLGTNCTFTIDYFARPTVAWNYVVVSGKALYNSTASTNFALHPAEEEALVMRILELAGIMLQKQDLLQAAMVDTNNTIQKQNN
tara:strand:- start:690 stop:1454 length:765 start_codon:yes stop_codon:yes gene_type:complete